MNDHSEKIEISSVLERLSVHLDLLAGQVFDVEEELGNLLTGHKSGEELSITKLQSLDFTRQSLEDCALLLQGLVPHTSSTSIEFSTVLAASNNLKLNSTRSILQSFQRSAASNVGGQVDIF